MEKVQAWTSRAAVYVRKHWFIFFLIASYAFFTVYYMGPAVTNCQNFVNGFGDSTGGPIWKYSINKESGPYVGHQTNTNYPDGESLTSVVDVSSVGQTMLIWAASKIAGPTCGYNLVNALGFMATALTMFGFVFWLIRNRWIAWLAGYAASFAPYFQVKVGIHPGYGFTALLIGVLWTFLALVQKPSKKRAILLGLLVGMCVYFDPYFSLLALTILLGLGLSYALFVVVRWRVSKAGRSLLVMQMKKILLAAVVAAVLIAPAVLTMLLQKSQIETAVSGTRDNIEQFATACSNWPQEYLLPFPESPLFNLFGRMEGDLKRSLYTFSTCGLSEDAVGIGVVLLSVVLLGVVVMAWEKANARRLQLNKLLAVDSRIVIGGVGIILVLAVLLGLPPVSPQGIPSPSELLVTTTSIWRVVAREYVVVNIAVIVLATITLTYFAKVFASRRKLLIVAFVGIFLILFVQYQTYLPFSGNTASYFDRAKIAPAYMWLKDQKDIKVIAEYPLEKATESNAEGYYLTMQSIHGKKLFNGLRKSNQETLRQSIKDLSDPQTVPVLASKGVDTVIVHGLEAGAVEKIPYLKVVYTSSHLPGKSFEASTGVDSLVIARIEGAPKARYALEFIDRLPINGLIQKSPIDWQYEIPSGTRIALRGISEDGAMDGGFLCFNIKYSLQDDVGKVSIINTSTNKEIDSVIANGISLSRVKISVPIGPTYKIIDEKGHNMRMADVGCGEMNE